MNNEVLTSQKGLDYMTAVLRTGKRSECTAVLTAIEHHDGKRGLVLKLERRRKGFLIPGGEESSGTFSVNEEEMSSLLQFLCANANLVLSGAGSYVKTSGANADLLADIAENLNKLDPIDLAKISSSVPTNVLDILMLGKRQSDVVEFEKHLNLDDWGEKKWQEFFEHATWIFGHALDFRFLHVLQREALVGGKTIANKDGQVIDFLMASGADQARFTALVDIKTPTAELLKPKQYRNRTYPPGDDLAGGVSQLQTNCHAWTTDASRSQTTVKQLDKLAVITAEPRGIIIAGNTSQLTDDDRKTSFELYRRNLRSPEVITFDELLSRAKYLTSSIAPSLEPPK